MNLETPTKPPRTKLIGDILGKGLSLWVPNAKDSIQSMRLALYTSEHLLEGTVFPAMHAIVSMQEQWTQDLAGTLRGESTAGDFARDTVSRARSGARFNRLVKTWGRDLFGSARLPGETCIAEDGCFKLTYIPATEGRSAQVPIFHAGGGIPYGDRIFRLLPEANLYAPFVDRGMPVYAMELIGDRTEVNYSGLTLSELVDAVERLSEKAFEHAGRKMVLEGYCGHGMQALAYLAAKPEDAARKLAAVALFVAPVHGPACTLIAQPARLTPERLNDWQLAICDALSGYIPGDGLRLNLDLALKKNFIKTPLGRFYDGWCQAELSEVKTLDDLTPAQRKILAGAYWISPANSNRFPISVDLVRYANAMFTKGLSPRGDLPFQLAGKPLSLAKFASDTSIPVFGFYGGTDPVILDRTAYPLMGILGDRYRHVVHPNAGHISYIFSRDLWDSDSPAGFRPNPIELLIDVCSTEA